MVIFFGRLDLTEAPLLLGRGNFGAALAFLVSSDRVRHLCGRSVILIGSQPEHAIGTMACRSKSTRLSGPSMSTLRQARKRGECEGAAKRQLQDRPQMSCKIYCLKDENDAMLVLRMLAIPSNLELACTEVSFPDFV